MKSNATFLWVKNFKSTTFISLTSDIFHAFSLESFTFQSRQKRPSMSVPQLKRLKRKSVIPNPSPLIKPLLTSASCFWHVMKHPTCLSQSPLHCVFSRARVWVAISSLFSGSCGVEERSTLPSEQTAFLWPVPPGTSLLPCLSEREMRTLDTVSNGAWTVW